MPLNLNPRPKELLEWHGHDRGGVHVPFQRTSNPYGSTIPTPLVIRLRDLARDIGVSPGYRPRWIFLVGGPGNGKSETVQDFLETLDNALGLDGVLQTHLKTRFQDGPVVPRRIEVRVADLPGSPQSFAEKVGRLIVVQDATATEVAQGNAAKELVEDLVDLLTDQDKLPPVFIGCANRGLLSRALREATKHWGGENLVTQLLVALIRASSLGAEALNARPSSWPLSDDDRVACWPLDLESLLASDHAIYTPFDLTFAHATAIEQWEISGRCVDCNSRELCPFRQNAEWLRDASLRSNLRKIVRRGELATGQRWNFRDLFSLTAELIVGQWSDFEGSDHPCSWVHRNAQRASVSLTGAAHAFALAEHLYPHALFRGHARPEETCRDLLDGDLPPYSRSFVRWICEDRDESSKPIREKLRKECSELDPSFSSPREPSHILRLVEDHFSQAVELGLAQIWDPPLTAVELVLLYIFKGAEEEWDLLGRDISRGSLVIQLLRQVAAAIVKRSIGVRRGNHALEQYLADFEAALRDSTRLRDITTALQPLLGENGFRFNVVESFGQPQAEEPAHRLVTLEGEKPGIVCHPAPTPTQSTPGHDMPSLEITGSSYRMPLTFEFYRALRLRAEGCAGSSLPASVRAALDRVRHRYAGTLFRNKNMFADGRARIVIAGRYAITLPDANSEPLASKT